MGRTEPGEVLGHVPSKHSESQDGQNDPRSDVPSGAVSLAETHPQNDLRIPTVGTEDLTRRNSSWISEVHLVTHESPFMRFERRKDLRTPGEVPKRVSPNPLRTQLLIYVIVRGCVNEDPRDLPHIHTLSL